MFAKSVASARRAVIRTTIGTTVVIATLEFTTHLPTQGRSSLLYHSIADNVVTPTLRKLLRPEGRSVHAKMN